MRYIRPSWWQLKFGNTVWTSHKRQLLPELKSGCLRMKITARHGRHLICQCDPLLYPQLCPFSASCDLPCQNLPKYHRQFAVTLTSSESQPSRQKSTPLLRSLLCSYLRPAFVKVLPEFGCFLARGVRFCISNSVIWAFGSISLLQETLLLWFVISKVQGSYW